MAFLLSFHPVVRNLDVMAGAQAASLAREEEGHWRKAKGAWTPVNSVESTH